MHAKSVYINMYYTRDKININETVSRWLKCTHHRIRSAYLCINAFTHWFVHISVDSENKKFINCGIKRIKQR